MYTTTEIFHTLRIPRARFQDWINRGYVFAEQPATGKGVKALYSRWYLYGIAFFRHLIEHGVDRSVAREYFKTWVSDDFRSRHESKDGMHVVLNGEPARYAIIHIGKQKPPTGHHKGTVVLNPYWFYSDDIQLESNIGNFNFNEYIDNSRSFSEIRVINLDSILV